MIEFKQVVKKYPGQVALNSIDMKLPKGKIIGIIGENGSGKSTTLKLIAGLIKPTTGTVSFNDKQVNRRISSKISYLSELDSFYDFYTVNETVEFFASQFIDFDMNKAKEIISFMNLDGNKRVKALSKGNRGRLKIVLTLSRNVPVILMDEPLSGLDPMVRESIIQGLISFIDLERQTVIITTHEVAEIETILDMVVAIHEGRVLAYENVEEIREKYNLRLIEWMKKLYQNQLNQ